MIWTLQGLASGHRTGFLVEWKVYTDPSHLKKKKKEILQFNDPIVWYWRRVAEQVGARSTANKGQPKLS